MNNLIAVTRFKILVERLLLSGNYSEEASQEGEPGGEVLKRGEGKKRNGMKEDSCL